jgi:hypothetical protein
MVNELILTKKQISGRQSVTDFGRNNARGAKRKFYIGYLSVYD